jgi:N-acetylneuraminate synthase
MRTKQATFVIAEAGVNHNGSMNMARRLIDSAAAAGADAVKFQTFRADRLVTRKAPKAGYQLRTTGEGGGQYEMIRALELSEECHDELAAHCASRGVDFLSTPFDSGSLRMLVERMDMRTIKISSGDITNAPLLLDVARHSRDVILSTGMSTLADVEAALGVLAFGFTATVDAAPGRAAFERAYASAAGREALTGRVCLLHCTTEYPAPIGEVNLLAMKTMATAFGLDVGYSDHTEGIHVPVAAVALGASVIEKHFTLDRSLPGPDHRASLEPAQLSVMVSAIRDVERALGDGVKRPSISEWSNREVARKSLVAARTLKVGERLEVECKRPGTGLSPFEYWTTRERAAARDYGLDEAIDG